MQSIEKGRLDRDASRIRAYARSERGEEEMESLLEACRARAREQGYEGVTATGDVGGMQTGTANARLAEVLQAVAGGGIDRLFISHLGAFGREPEQVHAVLDRLADSGVVIETFKEGPVGPHFAHLLAHLDLGEPQMVGDRKPAPGSRGRARRPR